MGRKGRSAGRKRRRKRRKRTICCRCCCCSWRGGRGQASRERRRKRRRLLRLVGAWSLNAPGRKRETAGQRDLVEGKRHALFVVLYGECCVSCVWVSRIGKASKQKKSPPFNDDDDDERLRLSPVSCVALTTQPQASSTQPTHAPPSYIPLPPPLHTGRTTQPATHAKSKLQKPSIESTPTPVS